MPESKREYGALSWGVTAIAVFVVLTVVAVLALVVLLSLIGFTIS